MAEVEEEWRRLRRELGDYLTGDWPTVVLLWLVVALVCITWGVFH